MRRIQRNNGGGFTLVETMVVVLIFGTLLGLCLPSFARSKNTAATTTCVQHLQKLQYAKENWAMEHSQPATAVPTDSDIAPYLKDAPTCPTGGAYTLGNVNAQPACSAGGGHQID